MDSVYLTGSLYAFEIFLEDKKMKNNSCQDVFVLFVITF